MQLEQKDDAGYFPLAYECPVCKAYGRDLALTEYHGEQYGKCHVCGCSFLVRPSFWQGSVFWIYEMGVRDPRYHGAA